MVRLIVYAFIGVSVLAAVPHYASRYQDALEERRVAEAESAVRAAMLAESRLLPGEETRYAAAYASGQVMRLQADPQGHFSGDFRVNGKRVEGLVDTGATFVAMNVSTARRLGVTPARTDFTHGVNTANGRTYAAKVRLDTVDLGPIRVRGVDAFVLEDGNLTMTLIGMSFMRKLKSYRVENGELLLVN